MTTLWTLDAMAAAMRADRSGALPDQVSGISIDSRTLAKGEAFFAIQGENRDGHEFVDGALKAGAGLAVVARSQRGNFAEAPLLVVPDVLDALRNLAQAARAIAREGHRCHRIGWQDRHERSAAAGAFRRRRNACVGCVLQ